MTAFANTATGWHRLAGRVVRLLAVVGLVAAVSACTNTGGDGMAGSDPYEAQNRAIHKFNKAADRAVLAPVSRAYGTVVPEPIRESVTNASNHLSLPGKFVNHLLQGDARDAGETFMRFTMNTIFGLGGLRDPASDAGLFERDTDFGETLARWGVRQGAYLELPLFGPSSERDLAGRIVDYAIDPVSLTFSQPALNVRRGLDVAALVDTRYELRGVIDTLLYESVDSYTAARIAYLQNKSRNTGGGLDLDDLEDPYAAIE